MALIDKLNRIKETKEGIKTTLIAKGVPVTDSDTFYSYIEKIGLLGDYSGGEIVYGNIVVSTNTLTVAEEATTTFTVNLDSQPSLSQTVSLSLDNSNVSIDKSSLTFTKDNYNQPQTVNVTGTRVTDSYDDLQSVLTLKTSTGTDVTINITISNIDVNIEEIPTTKISITSDGIDVNNLRVNKTYQFGYTREPSNATDEVTWQLNSMGSVDSSTGLVTTPDTYYGLEKYGYLIVNSGTKRAAQRLILTPLFDENPCLTTTNIGTSEYLSYNADDDTLILDGSTCGNYPFITISSNTNNIKPDTQYKIEFEVLENNTGIGVRVVYGALGMVANYSSDASLNLAADTVGTAYSYFKTKSELTEYTFRTGINGITSGTIKFKLRFIEILE